MSISKVLSANKKTVDKSPKTDIEEISQALKESIQLIPLISQEKIKNIKHLDQIFENLSKVIKLLGNRNSVYSIDIEGLDKNIDDEDKKYIQETCIIPRNSFVRTSSKFLVRKTIEVLKNYEISELVGILKRIGKE